MVLFFIYKENVFEIQKVQQTLVLYTKLITSQKINTKVYMLRLYKADNQKILIHKILVVIDLFTTIF